MVDAVTAEKGLAREDGPRRLSPGLAFLGSIFGLGLGYLYVGRIGYAVGFVVAPYCYMLAAGWTRLLVDPFGWYTYFPSLALIWLAQVVHPVALAWSRPLAPAKSYNRWWWYIAWLLGTNAAYTVVAPQRGAALGYEFYRIPADSMAPTVEAGDMIVVDTWRYRNAPPTFGDVVVCDLGDGVLVVKRVVGEPGDTIEVRGRLLVRNSRPVDEPYLRVAEPGSRMPDFGPLELGRDEFFVLGDYRDNSRDSRHAGPVSRDRISGRVEFIAFSRSVGRVNWERFPTTLTAD